jgi:signal transduction histidine kinase
MRERVERMGGRLQVASVPGKGTTVSFSIHRRELQTLAAEDSMRL